MTPSVREAVLVPVVLALLSFACKSGSSTTSPSSTPTTTAPASPTTSETFTGTLPVGGSISYSFTVSQYGTVNATLVSISGVGVPATVMVRLGIGIIGDTGCSASASSITRAGSSSQVTATEQPGVYCTTVSDVGNLFAPAALTVTVDHP